MSAFAAPAYGLLLQRLSGGGPLTLHIFQTGGAVGIAGILIAIVLVFFIKETGAAVRPPA
jgi:hypothetical protein